MEYYSAADADKAVRRLNGHDLHGQILTVRLMCDPEPMHGKHSSVSDLISNALRQV